VLVATFSGGVGFLAYLAAWIIIPVNPAEQGGQTEHHNRAHKCTLASGRATYGKIESGASKLSLVIPENVGVTIRLNGVSTSTNFIL
jgi:hypothetical protein